MQKGQKKREDPQGGRETYEMQLVSLALTKGVPCMRGALHGCHSQAHQQ